MEPRLTMPLDSQERKGVPIVTGVLDYFPAALAAVAKLSKQGNDKHNPGEPLNWARGKSSDHADCIGRHLADRGVINPETGMSHSVEICWRALAMLQLELEAQGAPLPRGATLPLGLIESIRQGKMKCAECGCRELWHRYIDGTHDLEGENTCDNPGDGPLCDTSCCTARMWVPV